MKEDFVTNEIAKKLKEKGFKYNKMNLLDRICMENQINHPTISQVLKWLREEHKIYMYVERDTYHLKFRFVYEKDKPRGKFTSSVYDKFEQAALTGIEYVLDNLI